MGYEPPLDDPIALGIEEDLEDTEEELEDDEDTGYQEPDRMWGDE